jgi:hypothetical protein
VRHYLRGFVHTADVAPSMGIAHCIANTRHRWSSTSSVTVGSSARASSAKRRRSAASPSGPSRIALVSSKVGHAMTGASRWLGPEAGRLVGSADPRGGLAARTPLSPGSRGLHSTRTRATARLAGEEDRANEHVRDDAIVSSLRPSAACARPPSAPQISPRAPQQSSDGRATPPPQCSDPAQPR